MAEKQTSGSSPEESLRKVKELQSRTSQQFSYALKWIRLLEQGEDLLSYFQEHGCRKIAIYGAAAFGVLLEEVLSGQGIQTEYFLDQKAEKTVDIHGVPVCHPDSYASCTDVDMVVVTAIFYFDEIMSALIRKRPEIPVVSMAQIIDIRTDEVWYEKKH